MFCGIPGEKEPYTGCTPLVSGEIAEDITSYYAVSEQVPTVCALGVLVNPDLTVRAAGGLLIQLLPFCPESVIDRLEQNIAGLEPMTVMLEKGLSLMEIIHRALEGFETEVLDEYDPAYRCTCSRERVRRPSRPCGRRSCGPCRMRRGRWRPPAASAIRCIALPHLK